MTLMIQAPVGEGRPPPVRLAVPEDEEALFGLCRMVHGENAIFSISPRKAREELRVAIQRQPAVSRSSLIGVVDDPATATPVGMAWLIQAQEWYSDEVYIAERFVFVHPAFREGTEHASHLLSWTRWVTDACRLRLLVGFASSVRTQAKLRLYRQRFGDPIGYTFLHAAEA